ncbi:MAG: hypothetical protein KZQ75_05410 [Candidatus Thiodiazotropha sp. (ex Myrtea spinifera)]|nr:hypothetical protein [Candidatus Thiodiazotropha sp. (ex Myrtea spinifera)]
MSIEFYEPNTLLQKSEKDMEAIPRVELFNNPKHQKLTESWCAAMFGIGYTKLLNECSVGVNETNDRGDADFFLLAKNQKWPFQLAEVQEEDRRRGQEYKKFADGTIKSILYNPSVGHKHGPEWIYNGILKKVRKKYAESNKLNLLIYANFPASDLTYESVTNRCKEFEGIFSSIWVLTSLHLCSIFSNENLGEIPGWGTVRPIKDSYL